MGDRQRPLLELTRARLTALLREPTALFWMFGFPVVLAVALGVAFRDKPPEPARVGVVAPDLGAERLRGLLHGASEVEVVDLAPGAGERALARGEVDVVVRLDPAAEPPALTYRFDPARVESRAGRYVADAVLQPALGRRDVAAISERTDAPLGGRYIDFLIPGLVGLNIMGGSMWGIAYALVDARRRRILRALVVTPMRRGHLLASYGLSRLFFLSLQVAALVGFGWLVFDVAVAGSLVDLAVVAVMGAASFAGVALLTASRTDSTEVVSGMMNFIMMPMWLLSGVFFSYERFPELVHPAIRALPLTALNDGLRAITIDGLGLASVLPELAVLAAWGVLGFLLATRWFRWQ